MAKRRSRVFGFGWGDNSVYKDWAKWISRGDAWPYDPDMGDSPLARLYISFTIGNLHTATQALLDIDLRADCPEAYDAAKAWLVAMGFPKYTCDQDAFCEKALAFLAELEQKHGQAQERFAAAEAEERKVDFSDLVRPRDGIVVQ